MAQDNRHHQFGAHLGIIGQQRLKACIGSDIVHADDPAMLLRPAIQSTGSGESQTLRRLAAKAAG